MPVPKIAGIETEYGIALRGGAAPVQVARDFFNETVDRPTPWDYVAESPAQDARGGALSGASLAPVLAELAPMPAAERSDAPISVSVDRDLSTLLPNGARFYIDHAHPEYCTPECLAARELVAHDKAGEHWLMQQIHRFNEQRAPDLQIILFKNNSDHQGHSYGCHENYLMAADVYQDLFNNKAHWLYAYVLPYLVTRQVFCGAGKVRVERGAREADYQISQRADFFEQTLGLQTMHDRPIVNTRDEPHANRARFRRLHVICGDANMAEWSTYLKVAVTQLVLAMLEAGALRLQDDVMLSNPVEAIKVISCDSTLKAAVDLERSGRQYTALQIQQVFLEAARRYLDGDASAESQWGQVWKDWAWAIEQLEAQPEALDRYLDWRIKNKFIAAQIGRKGISWQHAMAQEIDMKYHLLDAETGFFYLLREAGLIESVLTEDEIRQAMTQPPASTRAYLRGRCIEKYAERIASANWDVMTFRVGSGDEMSTLRLRLSDPTGYTQSAVEPLLGSEPDLDKLMAQLKRV